MQLKIKNNEIYLFIGITSPHDGTKSLRNKLLPKGVDINNALVVKLSTFETSKEDIIAYKRGIQGDYLEEFTDTLQNIGKDQHFLPKRELI